jgi:hypothetical protein
MPSPVAAEPSAAGSSPGDAYFVICVEQLPLTGTLFIHPVASSGAHHGRADDPLGGGSAADAAGDHELTARTVNQRG